MILLSPPAFVAAPQTDAPMRRVPFLVRCFASTANTAARLRVSVGILAIAICSAVLLPLTSSAQTNIYWDTSTNSGLGGSGLWSATGVSWATNPLGAAVSSGGPTGNALFIVTNNANGVNAWASGNYVMNFGGTAGTVTNGGSYQMWGINILTNGYVFTIDGTGANARTLTMTNSLDLGTNSLTFANGPRGTNSYTLAGPANGWTGGIIASNGSAGIVIANTNPSNLTNFGFYISSGGSISSNAPINILTLSNTRVMLGSQSSGGANFNSTITNNSAGGSPLELTNSSSGTLSFNGVISGSNGIVLNNSSSGRISLNAANTYSGGTTLNNTGSGTIQLSNAAAFGTGTITSAGSGVTNSVRAELSGLDVTNNWTINAGSTLRLNANNSGWNITASGVISGAGSMLFSNSGVNYKLAGINNSFGGGVTVGNGTLWFNTMGMAGANSSLGTNGVLQTGAGTTTAGFRWTNIASEISDKSISLNSTTGGLTFLLDSATAGVSLTINGSITSTASGNKTITLNANNTNTLTINGVINEFAGSTNSIVVNGGSVGTLILGNITNSFGGGITISGGASSTNTVQVAQIGNAGANSALGTNGTINIGGSSASGINILAYAGSGETSDKVINLAGASGGATLDQSGTGNLKFTTAMTATGVGAKTLTLQGSTVGTGEIASNLGDLGGNVITLTKSGSGTWTLSGNNSYSGTTTVSGGTLVMSGSNSSSGTTTLSGGTLAVTGTNSGNGNITMALGTTLDVSGKLIGTNSISVNNAGALLKIGQTNGLANALLLGASSGTNIGIVNLAGGGAYLIGAYGNSASGGQNMAFTNSSGLATTLSFASATNYITTSSGNSAGRILTNSSADLTIIFGGTALDIGSSANNDATFTGSGNYIVNASVINTNVGVRNIIKSGTGALTLGASNSYNGTTTVSGGTLRIGNSDALGTTSNGTTVANGAALELTNGISVGNESLTIGGSGISAGGALRSLGGDNTYGGVVTLSTNTRINADAGILRLTNGTIGGGAFDLTLGGAGNVAVSSVIGTSTGSLTKDGAGTATLSGANNYSGVTTISGGTLIASNNSALGSGSTASVGGGATLQVSANISKGTITNNGAIVVNQGASLTATSLGAGSTGSLSLSGALGNQAVFTDNGAQGTSGSSTVLDVGNLTLSGYATLALNNAYNKILSSGSVSISGTGNLFSLSGSWDAGQSYTLLEGTTGFSASGIQLTGTTLGGASLSFGQNTTVGRSTYLFDTNATSLFITVTGGAGNITWNTNSGIWDTSLANTPWTNNADGSASAFYGGDNVTLGTPGSDIQVEAGGVLAGAVTVNNDSGMVTLYGGTITNTSLSKTGAGSVTVSNNIVDTGALTVSAGGLTAAGTVGAASLVVSGGEASFSGVTDIGGAISNSAGSLTVGTNALTANSLVVNGGTTTLNGATTVTNGITVSSGSLAANGNGLVTVKSGDLSISGGSVSLNAGSAITNDVSMSGGTLTVSNANNVAGALRLSGGTIGGGGTITAAGGYALTNGSVGAILAGSGAVTKAGTGTIVLSAANTYSGTTTVSGGTLTIQNGSALGATNGSTLVTNNSTLALEGGITAGPGELLSIVGGSTLKNVSGNNTYAGPIFFASSGLSNAIIFASDAGTLTLASFATNTTLSSARLVEVTGNGNTLITGRFTGTGSSTVTKNGSGTLTLANTNFDIAGGFIVNAGTLVLDTNNALGATRPVVVNGGTLNIGTYNNTVGAVTLTNGTITGSTGVLSGTSYAVENGTISAILGGSGVLTKTSAGTVTLSGANTYSGGTLVSAGVLSGDTTSLQGAITNNAAVIFNQATNGTFAYVLSGSGTLLKTNAGTLVLINVNTQSGGTTIGQGTLQIGNGGSTVSLAGDITNNGTLAYNLTGASTQSTVISGSGAVTKAGAGTVTLSGANTYSGGTLVSAGALAGDTTSLQGLITNNATLVFNQSSDGTFSSVISGTGALVKTNAGTLTLSGINTYSGATTINAGTLAINGTNTGSGTVTLSASNSVLKLGRTNALANGVLVGAGSSANTGTVDLTVGGNHSIASYGNSGTAAGNINFTNSSGSAATLTFSAATNYVTSGNNGGRTVANNSTNLTLVFSGDVDISSTTAGNATFSGAGNMLVNGGIVNNSNGVRSLVKNGVGTLTLAGANTYNGTTTISAGTLQVGNGGTSGAFGTNTVSVATNSLLVFNRSDSFTVSNAVSGAGSLTKSGNGTLTLAGANTYTGGTLIGSGVLAGDTTSLQGSITNNTTLVFNQTTNGVNSSAISGIGELVKEGSGAVELGANTYSGGTLLNGGAIYLGANNALGTGTVTIGDGTILASVTTGRTLANNLVAAGNFTLGNSTQATTFNGNFDLGGATRTISLDNSATFNGLVSNGGLIITNINATNTRNFTLAASNTFGGGITLNSGNLRLGHVNAAGTGSITQADGNSEVQIRVTGTITNAMSLYRIVYANDSELSGALTLNNTVFDVNANITATNSGVLSGTGGVDKIGAGTLILSGSNTYSGGTSISNGAVSISADNNLGAVPGSPTAGNVTLDGGKLLLTAGLTLSANRGVALGASGGIIEVASAQSVSYGGVAAGAGGFTKSGGGSFTFSGANTFSGGTAVSAGTLELANTSGASLGSTASVSVASGATLLISQNNQVNDTASVSLSGGTIRTATGVSEAFGNLSVTSASFLDFGTTSYANQNTISFGTYTPSALLSIDNFNFGSTMIFKTDLTSSINDITKFSFSNGGIGSYSWNSGTSTFTITAIPEPSTYVAAVALLGLMLWPSRRRLLKDAKSILGLRTPARDRLRG